MNLTPVFQGLWMNWKKYPFIVFKKYTFLLILYIGEKFHLHFNHNSQIVHDIYENHPRSRIIECQEESVMCTPLWLNFRSNYNSSTFFVFQRAVCVNILVLTRYI